MKQINIKMVKKAILLYKKGYSQQTVANKLNYSQSTIYKWLKRNKIKCRSNEFYRKTSINEKVFNKWSSNMAYMLGFISSDGNIFHHTLHIKLHKKDKEILNFFRRSIGLVTLEKDNKQNQLGIRFNSKYIVHSLKNLGITSNKTFTIRAPKYIPKKYIGDYIRGVFDGDGWISIRPGKRKGLAFGICSASKNFIKDIRKLCGNIGAIRCRSYEKDPIRKPQYYFENYKNNDAIILRNLLYKNNNFALQRKKKIFFSRL